jgi:hypothetical protein
MVCLSFLPSFLHRFRPSDSLFTLLGVLLTLEFSTSSLVSNLTTGFPLLTSHQHLPTSTSSNPFFNTEEEVQTEVENTGVSLLGTSLSTMVLFIVIWSLFNQVPIPFLLFSVLLSCFASRPIPCSSVSSHLTPTLLAGDIIFGGMKMTGTNTWVINSTDITTNTEPTVQTVTRPRLSSQPWAYLTLETYNIADCTWFPPTGASIEFSQLELYDTSNYQVTPAWQINQNAAHCSAVMTVNSPDDAVIAF